MCDVPRRQKTDKEIWDFLDEKDFQGDITPAIAREVALDFLTVYPRSGKESGRLLAQFRDERNRVIPLTKYQRQELADFLYPPVLR